MFNKEVKPIKRSKFRLWLGKRYYIIRRYLQWGLSGKKYAKRKDDSPMPYVVFAHRTLLLRKLKDVDMNLQYNKITNLKIATARFNNVVIKPGETFSYWKLIGKPTYKKGYLDGLVLCSDGSFKPGVGGGLCQLSNLIYWMTLHSPITVVERHRHSHDVFPDVNRTQPFGTGATCSYNYLDLQIYNGTNSEFQFLINVGEKYLEGELRCSNPCRYKYEVYEKEHQITRGIFAGCGYMRNNLIFRYIYNDLDELIKDEYVTENHAYMVYEPFLN